MSRFFCALICVKQRIYRFDLLADKWKL